MQLVLLALLAILITHSKADDADVSVCKNPTPVDAFASSFYTAKIVSNDPKVVDTLEIGGSEAGMIVYNELKKNLEEQRVCSYEEIAFKAATALAQGGTLNLPTYFRNVAYTIARALFKFDVLNCSNPVALSLELYGYVQHEKKGLDDSKFGTYIHGMVYGFSDLIKAHGLNIEEVKKEGADLFHQSFTENKPQNNCVVG